MTLTAFVFVLIKTVVCCVKGVDNSVRLLAGGQLGLLLLGHGVSGEFKNRSNHEVVELLEQTSEGVISHILHLGVGPDPHLILRGREHDEV